MTKKPAKLTLLQAQRLIERNHPGLWEKFTPEERREALHRLNRERDAEPVKAKPAADVEAFIRRQFRKPR